MGLKITQVDAFTREPFKGNPAAVCVLPEPKSAEWMHHVAEEMNLSETAFLLKEGDAFRLRWFTPRNEVKLCGHATLASAHVLWEEEFLSRHDDAKFQTLSGLLFAKYRDGWIELNFPVLSTEPMPAPDELLEAFHGVSVTFTGKSAYTWLLELESEEALRQLQPDFRALKTLDRDVLVTAISKSGDFDFVSRYFAPRHGIDEDPVTGSAHCVLAPYWAEKLDKREMSAYQASERGGFVNVRLEHDRVHLIGQAVTVLRGELVESGIRIT
jgi:PhzF family phenazine biosynthesis protein